MTWPGFHEEDLSLVQAYDDLLRAMTPLKYWLMKSEPDVYSIADLFRDGETLWTGVRNYQARNFMMNEMTVGDEVLFYHSNAEIPGVAGLARIVSAAKPDPEQFDKKSEYYDPKASRNAPRWWCVQVGFKEKFREVIPLAVLRQDSALKEMLILRPGNRLSITPVSPQEFRHICKLAAV